MRLTIGQKLIGTFVVVAMIAVTLFSLAIGQLTQVGDTISTMAQNEHLYLLDGDLVNIQRMALRHLVETDPRVLAKESAEIAAVRDQFEAQATGYQAIARNGTAQLAPALADYREYIRQVASMLALPVKRHKQALAMARTQVYPMFRRTDAALTALIKQQGGEQAEQRVTRAYRTMFTLALATIVSIVIVLLSLGWLVTSQIRRDLRKLSEAAERIANGDLDQQLSLEGKDELAQLARMLVRVMGYFREVAAVSVAMSAGDLSKSIVPKGDHDQLGHAIAQMMKNLRDVVTRVRVAADAVGAGAGQMSASSSQLSKASTTQAAGAEETSATMEQMAAVIQSVDSSVSELCDKVSQVRDQNDELVAAVNQTSGAITQLAASIQQVAGNVVHANEAAESAADAAQEGDLAVAKTISGMDAISETMIRIRDTIKVLDQRSVEIGAIIEVIDDIADQTNLLALNAAIEAARAGDAGRGFAVVADEIRKLAERSAKATKEIGDLIKGIQKETAQAVGVTQQGAAKVTEGSELASHTGLALDKIKQAASQVAELLNEVTATTKEQAQASSQIVTAAERMTHVTQQVNRVFTEMDLLTKTVTYATSEQRQGTNQVVAAVENLSQSAQEANRATDQVSQAALDLNHQAESLQQAVAFFSLGGHEAPLELRVSADVPAGV